MNRKAGYKELRAELAACREACGRKGGAGGVYLIARMERNLSEEAWDEFCKTHSMSDWLALRLPDELAARGASCKNVRDWLQNSPWILSAAAFRSRLDGELLRVARGGGALCLLLASVMRPNALGTPLDEILKETLDSQLEACDSLSALEDHTFGVILPGLGQLKSRRFAESAQAHFREAAGKILPNAEEIPPCAVGLVNIVPGEYATSPRLLNRARKALEYAREDKRGHIYQESPTGDASGATLVHSNEKHFLFFGGIEK